MDIDECQDPELASLCVDNAECCNLPAHFVCKCKEGFEGDGTKECRGMKINVSIKYFSTYQKIVNMQVLIIVFIWIIQA